MAVSPSGGGSGALVFEALVRVTDVGGAVGGAGGIGSSALAAASTGMLTGAGSTSAALLLDFSAAV